MVDFVLKTSYGEKFVCIDSVAVMVSTSSFLLQRRQIRGDGKETIRDMVT